jgi:2-polyprenyl-3-methyl-5-hydroxy-6-metoxy-1,4-benzoquinol methylase
VDSHYTGIELELEYAELSQRYCDRVLHANVEHLDEGSFDSLFPSDCWVFADSLEHLQDPWQVLRRVRSRIDAGGSVVACIPNAQHWSVQVRLNCGLLRYEIAGLLDRTHLRWFTRITIGELFETSGFRIVEGGGRVIDEPEREKFFPAIAALARAGDRDPEIAMKDAIPWQWLVRAEPI